MLLVRAFFSLKGGLMNKYISLLVAIIFSIILINCTTHKVVSIPLSHEASQNINGKTCAISRHEPPSFQAITRANAAQIPAIGIRLTYSEGKDIIANNNIEDPAVYISQEIALALRDSYSVNILNPNSTTIGSNSLDAICETYKDSDFVLDVETTKWCITHYSLFSDKHGIIYGAHIRIINTRTKEVIAEEFVGSLPIWFYNPNDLSRAPTYAELIDNNAALLKSELRKAADESIKHFKHNNLNLN
jgi:hypothetical protein